MVFDKERPGMMSLAVEASRRLGGLAFPETLWAAFEGVFFTALVATSSFPHSTVSSSPGPI